MNRTYMFLNMGGKSNSAEKKKTHTHTEAWAEHVNHAVEGRSPNPKSEASELWGGYANNKNKIKQKVRYTSTDSRQFQRINCTYGLVVPVFSGPNKR